jgi:hypothetical protein
MNEYNNNAPFCKILEHDLRNLVGLLWLLSRVCLPLNRSSPQAKRRPKVLPCPQRLDVFLGSFEHTCAA